MLKQLIRKNTFLYTQYKNASDIYHRFIVDHFYVFWTKANFKKAIGYPLNLKKPYTFNEKIQWLKNYYRDPIMTQCADKFGVRELVAKKIGNQYLTPIYGVYDSVEDINLDKLPEQFVLKPTNSSGCIIICKDKHNMDWKKEFSKLKRWLDENYYYQNGEWVYKDIKPRIVCEKLLYGEMIDYKFMCFYGEPQLLFTCSERDRELKVTFFDMNFDRLPFIRKYPASDHIQKPKYFNDMVRCAKILSRRFPFVRVDFYENEGKVYFGELTFFPGNGMEWFKPVDWDRKIGDLLNLNRINRQYIIKNSNFGVTKHRL